MEELASATTISIVNKGKFEQLTIPIAPLPEQHRIVAAIEEQFTRLDAAVAALKRAQANLKRYRASVLKAACEGRLVPTEAELARHEGRDYEPASALLEKFGVYNIESVQQPEGWASVLLSQVAEIQGGIQKQPKRAPRVNRFPFLRVANVLRGRLDLSEIHEVELFRNELERLRLTVGDLLIVEGNGSPGEIGRMAIWSGLIKDCVHQNHIIRARLCGAVVPEYAQTYWNSVLGVNAVKSVASSTSGLYTLSVAKVGNIRVPIPPQAEQERIVAEIERRLSVIQQAEATTEASLKRAEKLRQSILKRAFEGQLVPQDPDDEPASVLLERIKRERVAQPPPMRRNTRRRAGVQLSLGEASA